LNREHKQKAKAVGNVPKRDSFVKVVCTLLDGKKNLLVAVGEAG
jgi:hypothetical protein